MIIGYGNPSRGDDALGPSLLEQLQELQPAGMGPAVYEPITDFQLQIEHVTDLASRNLLLFVDASLTAGAPFEFTRLTPQRDHSYSSHSLSPATLLSVYQDVYKTAPPPAYLLTIPGYSFELGAPLGPQASAHLLAATEFVVELLRHPHRTEWDAQLAR